jgi:chemotaxis protein methyltransferase CheR
LREIGGRPDSWTEAIGSDTISIQCVLSDREFQTFRRLIATSTGIALGPHKRALLQARLGSRMRALGLTSFTDYRRILVERGATSEEFARFVNSVTTTKTDFYREAGHWAYLAEHWVPQAVGEAVGGGRRIIRIWSAGCSTGEEPYTIAMTLTDALKGATGWDLRVLASDINTDVLRHAAAGIYDLEDVRPVPPAVLRRHFLRGRGTRTGLVRLRPALRGLVTFRRINLVEEGWPIRTRFDVIFCRNVFIYFDRATQQRVLARLLGFLKAGGVLMLGHSERVQGAVTGLRHISGTIYRKEIDNVGDHPRG